MWVEKHGKTYRIRDLVAGQKVTIQSGYATKTAAKAALAGASADKQRGEALVPRGGRITVNEWVDTWWPAYVVSLKPSAAHSEGGRLRNHIRPLLGHLALDDLQGGMAVQQWIAQLLAGTPSPRDPAGFRRRKLAPKTARSCHGLLHTILQAAVRQRLIPANPCATTSLPRLVHREMRFLTEPEIARLLAALPAHWRPMVLLLISTGLRWGEAAGLRVGRLDLLAKVPKLTVLEAMHESSGTGEILFTEPKTARSRRTVTFTTKVALALTPLVVDRERDDLVFTAPMGGAARTRNFRRVWLAALKRAGLEGVRVHDLRHTHAAVLISAGVPLTAIQRRLGHTSIVVTSDLYGHLMPEVDEGIIAAVEAALAGVDPDAMADEVAAELVGA